MANTVPNNLRFRYLPELRHTSIQQRRLNMKEEFANNRGMAIMPLPLTIKLFEKLADCGYINPTIHKRCFWAGAAVVISSNDSAKDIYQAVDAQWQPKFKAKANLDHCFKFVNPPPFWSLPENTVFVSVVSDEICSYPMFAEVGSVRKGPKQNGRSICDDVERMLLVQTPDSWVLIYPSLRGHGKSASIAYSSNCDLATCHWFVGVNPLLGLFEERPRMQLLSLNSEAVPRNHAPTFGWENYELQRMRGFNHAATISANRGGLRSQTIHSDHRRVVETGMYVSTDPSRLNQEHRTWQTLDEWANHPREKVPAPKG